jgi:SAM-dependent methyltransferase
VLGVIPWSLPGGYGVCGVDRTRAYLERARALASAEDLKVEFLESDVRSFSRRATFDAAISMFTSFGYFEDPANDLKVVQSLLTFMVTTAPTRAKL